MDFNFYDTLSFGAIEKVIPAKGKIIYFEPPGHSILIVTRGSLKSIKSFQNEKGMEWGEMIFLPYGSSMSFLPATGTELLFFHIPDCINFLQRFFFSLEKENKTEKRKTDRLILTPVLWEYIRNLDTLLSKSHLSSVLIQIKISELFCLLNICYSKELINQFFKSIIKDKNNFRNFVWQNYLRIKNVEEFARLSHLSLSSFEKKFKASFGIAPYRWMTERKKELIYYGITNSGCQIQELSDKYGFSSPSQLNDFCKKHMGLTPGQIRRRGKL